MSKKPSYYFDAFVTKIDPSKSGSASLVYSTFLGGDTEDYGYGIAADRNGCAYVTGHTLSSDYPTTPNAIQKGRQGKGDVFITKLSADGLSLVYSTILGDDKYNTGYAIEVDDTGCAFVSGICALPATPGAFTASGSYFICKLNAAGDGFVYSSRVSSATRLAVDINGNVYATSNYLALGGGNGVMALNSDGTDTLFTYKTIIVPSDVAVDADGFVYVTGSTNSQNFETTAGSFRPTPAGSYDAVVAKWQSKEMLVVKVLSDPYDQVPHPIRNTPVKVLSVDLSNRASPLALLARQTTDKKGLLRLPVGAFQPGMQIVIRTMPERKPTAKWNRTEHTAWMYKVYVDNLVVHNDGSVGAQLLDSDPNDTTEVYMDHTSVGFSLVAAIEWLASPEYIENLKSAFRKTSNLMYDVTNGQAFIDTVAIFDNGDNWGSADIQFHANNLMWPQAHVKGIATSAAEYLFMPPAFYDASSPSTIQIESIYNAEPIDPSVKISVTSLIHELGHYALGLHDEYKNSQGQSIFPNVNFGFMDNPDDLIIPICTEMSDYQPADAKFADYTQTKQYQQFNKNSWDFFKQTYDRSYGDVVACIHRPRDFGVFPDNVVAGPNSDWNHPDFSVGDMMGFDIKAVTSTKPRREYLFTHPAIHLPVAGAMVKLRKQEDWAAGGMVHGATTPSGRIKLFNTENGDHVYATHNAADENWLYIETLVGPALPKAGNVATTIEMKTVRGRFTLLAGMAFDAAGKPVYQCQADPAFASQPTVQVSDGDSQSEEQVLSSSAGLYSAVLNKSDFTEGSVFFSAPDSLGGEFFVSQNVSIRDVSGLGNDYYFPGLRTNLNVDLSGTTAEKAALLASGFPVPVKGLPDSVRRVSDAIALNVHPAASVLKGLIQIHYYADSLEALVPGAMKLYHWKNGWVPLATGVDLVHNTVAAALDGAGYYAAFLDLTRSRVTGVSKGADSKGPSGWMMYLNYPNPFNPSTRIPYDVPMRSSVKIEIFDLLGRKVRTLADGVRDVGTYTAVWDGCNDTGRAASAGIYICRLTNGSVLQIRKMALIR